MILTTHATSCHESASKDLFAIFDPWPYPSLLVSASSWVVDFCVSAKASCCFCTVVCNSFSSSCDFIGSGCFFQAKVSAAFLLKTQTSKIRRLDVNRPLLFGGCGQGSFHLRNCGLRMVFEVTPRSLKFLGYYFRVFF